MSESNPFVEALRQAVGRINSAFADADKALHEAVATASDAVNSFTGGRYTLELDLRRETPKGRRYDLDIGEPGGTLGDTVGTFFVPQSGFPILFGSTSPAGRFEAAGKLGDPEDLREYLLTQMSNPDSPLTVFIAYQLRKATE